MHLVARQIVIHTEFIRFTYSNDTRENVSDEASEDIDMVSF